MERTRGGFVRPLMTIALAGVLSFGIPGLRLIVTTVEAQQVDRGSVILKAIDAFNRHDVSALLTSYTDEALFIGGAPCQPATPCIGKAAFRKPFEAAAVSHASVKVINLQIRGSVATGRLEVRSDGIRAKGAERIINFFLAEVPKELITVWVAVPDFTDPDTARVFAPQ